MNNLREKYETNKLDDLCNLLTEEITNLATSDYKLKLILVLVHIINESQKVLEEQNMDDFIEELRGLVTKACEKTEKQKEVQKLRFTQDKAVRDVIDGTCEELIILDRDIEPLLARYENILKSLVELRDSMSTAERAVTQKQ